jgi:hypothetical protein
MSFCKCEEQLEGYGLSKVSIVGNSAKPQCGPKTGVSYLDWLLLKHIQTSLYICRFQDT